MSLTSAQLAQLKADIEADGTLNAFPNTPDGAFAIAQIYNAQASPDFTVWKTSVPMVEIGKNIDGAELANRTTGDNTRLQTIVALSGGFINPSNIDQRMFFDDVFSGAGGDITRPKLLALWKRLSTRGEKLFAIGTGSDIDPATLVIEGNISYNDVLTARNLP